MKPGKGELGSTPRPPAGVCAEQHPLCDRRGRGHFPLPHPTAGAAAAQRQRVNTRKGATAHGSHLGLLPVKITRCAEITITDMGIIKVHKAESLPRFLVRPPRAQGRAAPELCAVPGRALAPLDTGTGLGPPIGRKGGASSSFHGSVHSARRTRRQSRCLSQGVTQDPPPPRTTDPRVPPPPARGPTAKRHGLPALSDAVTRHPAGGWRHGWELEGCG